MSKRRRAVIGTALALGLALSACGSSHPHALRPRPAPATTTTAATTTTVATVPSPPNSTLIATTHGAIPSFAAPEAATATHAVGAPESTTVPPVPAPVGAIPASWYGSPSALPVIAQAPGWVEVRLAQRPNESVAWVHSSDVSLTSTPYRIVISLSTEHVQLWQAGQMVLDAPAGIGTTTDPTPTGEYFVALMAAAPSSGYGPFVVVTSAHSDAITDWEGSGDAIIAIHGPLGEDAAIGTAGAKISHGCVRMHDADLSQLRPVPVGSPVDIVA